MTSDTYNVENEPQIFLLGISGPSSAGKSTLAYLLSSVSDHTFSIHSEVCKERGIVVQEAMSVSIEDTLVWAVDRDD